MHILPEKINFIYLRIFKKMLQNLKATKKVIENRQLINILRFLNSTDKENSSLKKAENEIKSKALNVKDKTITILTGYMKKFKSKDDDEGKEERKGPFKNYYEYEERDKNKIIKYEEFIDRNTRNKDRENFIVWI